MIVAPTSPRLPRRKSLRGQGRRWSRRRARRSRPTVMLSWSDPDTHGLAVALDRLVTGTFGGRIGTWLSPRELDARDWRTDVERATVRSSAAIVVLGPHGPSPRLLYQAGACFREGATFAFSCGVGPDALRGTPLEAMRVWTIHERTQVMPVIRAVGAAVGDRPQDFEARFDAAWPAFAAAVGDLAGGIERRRRVQEKADEDERLRLADAATWARHRWIATLTAVPAALLVVAVAPWAWALWPSSASPASCTSGTTAQRAQCEWEQALARAGGAATPDPHAAARIGARPFAVLAFTAACRDRAVAHDVRIAGPGAAGDGWRIPVLFARAGVETSAEVASAVTLASGDRLEVLAPNGCAATPGGALTVRHVGTLNDAAICPTLARIRLAFGGHPGFVDQFTAHLAAAGLGPSDRLRPSVLRWLGWCGLS